MILAHRGSNAHHQISRCDRVEALAQPGHKPTPLGGEGAGSALLGPAEMKLLAIRKSPTTRGEREGCQAHFNNNCPLQEPFRENLIHHDFKLRFSPAGEQVSTASAEGSEE